LLIVLSFLIPPAIYLLTLAFRNRGRHPVMLSGRWDFAGVVFAMSGFLLLGGPAILAALYQRWRLSWVLGRTRFLNGVAENWYFWISLWILYFAAVIMCIALVMWRRRHQTSIYNIEPSDFDSLLRRALQRLGLPWACGRAGRIVFGDGQEISPRNSAVGTPAVLAGQPLPDAPGAAGLPQQPSLQSQLGERAPDVWPKLRPAALVVEPFPALRHITLHWRGDYDGIRPAVEEELGVALQQAPAADNPASNWFLSASLCLFFAASLLLVRLILDTLHSIR